jgi:hypothetical protein
LSPRHPGLHEKRVPGLYDNATGGTEIVAAAPGESSVVTATPEALRLSFGVPDTTIQTITPQDDPALTAASVPWRHEFWPWAVALLLGLLMVENIVATRRPTSSA